MTTKLLWGTAIVGLLLGLWAVFGSVFSSPSFGAVGVKLAENYDPYLRYNGGYNSALPLKTTSTITGATITANTLLSASSTQLTAAPSCIELYATSTATLVKEVFVTTGATSTYNGTVYWAYGACL